MLTYQFQDRVLIIEGNGSPEFPNKMVIKVKLGPPEAFGASNGLSRWVIRGRERELSYNANTGRTKVQLKPPLEALNVIVEMPDVRFELKADTLRYEAPCENAAELTDRLMIFQYLFPALLNVGFADPPVVLYIRGKIGETTFRCEHLRARFLFRPVSLQEIEQHVVDSLTRLGLFHGTVNRRLLAALQYFYVASRLIVAGNSDWEFMAESVLNMCKVLEILFGNSRDFIRKGLSALDYTPEEIEGDFIPLMILRNHFDIGHPRMAIPKQEQLQILYEYLEQSEIHFRDLFQRLFERIADGSFKLPQQEDLHLDPQAQKKFDDLIDTIKTRIIPAGYVVVLPAQ